MYTTIDTHSVGANFKNHFIHHQFIKIASIWKSLRFKLSADSSFSAVSKGHLTRKGIFQNFSSSAQVLKYSAGSSTLLQFVSYFCIRSLTCVKLCRYRRCRYRPSGCCYILSHFAEHLAKFYLRFTEICGLDGWMRPNNGLYHRENSNFVGYFQKCRDNLHIFGCH